MFTLDAHNTTGLEHYYCIMMLALLVLITFAINKTLMAQKYSTLLLTPTCIGAITAIYLHIFYPATHEQYQFIEHDYFLIV